MTSGREDLAERCARGDSSAFREVVARYGRQVEGTIVRILGPRSDLEDLVQQVFLELARAVRRFRGDSSFGTFVMGIAANVARRVIERGPKAPIQIDLAALPGPDDPEARAAARETLSQLLDALERLDAKKRIAFVLHVVEGRPISEVSQIVGANEKTVRTRIDAAREELARRVERGSR